MGALDGKVAVITGGAGGIGRATAVRFAAEGADVVIGDLAPGDDVVAEVEKAGGRAVHLRTDTTREDDCEALVALAVDTFGRVDVGVASAGIATAAGPSNVQTRTADVENATHVVNLATERFERVLDVNVIGVMQTDRALARRMVAQGSGSIVNIASSAARIPLAGAAPYCVSKAGVWMLTKVLGLELATTGVRVNAVGPGYTATPMIDGISEQPAAFASAMSITPMNRLGRPEEIAAACLFLATDESSFMTGQMLHPAGGQFTG